MSITSYIKQDLLAHICSGKLPTHSLTLDDLSKRYDVSMTPVRAAIRELIKDGYLQKAENRRLAVVPRCKPATSAFAPPVQPKDYYKIIAGDLVRLSLKGEAVAIREGTTAKKYGISRSSVTKIFSRLAGDGILQHLPRRGWQLRPFRKADLDAYTEIRVMMEVKALNLAWPRLVDEDLQAMLDRNRMPNGPGGELELDNSLHDYLVAKADNHYISEFFDRHAKYYNVLFESEALDREARISAIEQHRDILEALLRRDRAAAEQALVNHICNNHPVIQRMIQNHQSNNLAQPAERSLEYESRPLR